MTPITIPVAELKSGLSGLGKVIHPKGQLPVLHCLRVERTPDGWICLTATDLDRFITLRLEQPARGEPFAMLVPFADLLRLTKSCGKEEKLHLEPGPNHSVTIRFAVADQTGQTHVQSPPADEFPTIPKVFTDKSFPVTDELRTALHEAFACCSTDATRAVLHGAFLDVTRPKAHYVVATDGRHLYSCNSFRLPFQHPIIIPRHKFLAWREFNLDGPWQMKVGTSSEAKTPPLVQISSRRWRFVTRQIEGPYPDWRVAVPQVKPALRIEIDASHLDSTLRALERLPCHDERFHTLGLEWKAQGLSLLGKPRPEDPWTRVPVKTTHAAGPDLTIFVDREYVLKALSFGLTTLECADALSPLRFSHGGRQMIIMPLRGDPIPSTDNRRSESAPAPSPSTLPRPADNNPPPSMSHQEENQANQDGARRSSVADTGRSAPLREPAERPALEAALTRLETVKAGCREAVAELSRVSDELKQFLRSQRASHRETQTLRNTLRSLQSLRV
jgi:DNA polymerase III sliding clamp (beta) subunit (PCNA family)